MAACQWGADTMLIWLGKQMLGQKDKVETEAINTHHVSGAFVLGKGDPAEIAQTYRQIIERWAMRVDPKRRRRYATLPAEFSATLPIPRVPVDHDPSVCRGLASAARGRSADQKVNGIHVGFRSKRAPGQRRGSRAGARESPAIPATCSDWGRPY